MTVGLWAARLLPGRVSTGLCYHLFPIKSWLFALSVPEQGKMYHLGWCFPEGSVPQCPLANAFEFGQLKVIVSVSYLFFSEESSVSLDLLIPWSKTAKCLAN